MQGRRPRRPSEKDNKPQFINHYADAEVHFGMPQDEIDEQIRRREERINQHLDHLKSSPKEAHQSPDGMTHAQKLQGVRTMQNHFFRAKKNIVY